MWKVEIKISLRLKDMKPVYGNEHSETISKASAMIKS